VRSCFTNVGLTLVVLAVAAGASAQSDPVQLTRAEIDVACASSSGTSSAPHSLRVVGLQDVVARNAFDNRDLLVINGGTTAGVQLGAEFFVRRNSQFGMGRLLNAPVDVVTDGWVRIVAVNETTSIAKVDHVCGTVFVDDYLEPYTPPVLPANIDGSGDAGEADFTAMARIVAGHATHGTSSTGEFVTIDRGTEAGVQPGTRFALYRDLTQGRSFVVAAEPGVPLAPLGEAVAISASGSRSVIKILRARDAVQIGDYAVLRR